MCIPVSGYLVVRSARNELLPDAATTESITVQRTQCGEYGPDPSAYCEDHSQPCVVRCSEDVRRERSSECCLSTKALSPSGTFN